MCLQCDALADILQNFTSLVLQSSILLLYVQRALYNATPLAVGGPMGPRPLLTAVTTEVALLLLVETVHDDAAGDV